MAFRAQKQRETGDAAEGFCFARKNRWPWFIWGFNQLPGPSISPKRTPTRFAGSLQESPRILDMNLGIPIRDKRKTARTPVRSHGQMVCFKGPAKPGFMGMVFGLHPTQTTPRTLDVFFWSFFGFMGMLFLFQLRKPPAVLGPKTPRGR